MTSVLILGGTRFAGRATAERLLARRCTVTIASRHPLGAPAGAEIVVGERQACLEALSGRRFDTVLDFIAFDGAAPIQTCESVRTGLYVLVSSLWVPRLVPGTGADMHLPEAPWTGAPNLLPVTRSYLAGKAAAEHAVSQLRMTGQKAAAIRIPIMFGSGDRTGRFEFYAQRVGEALLLIDGGANHAQIVWSEDVANVLGAWLLDGHGHTDRSIWVCAPDMGRPVAEWIGSIAEARGVEPVLIPAPSKVLRERLPGYLEAEPLWRESPLDPGGASLFQAAQVEPTRPTQWLRQTPPAAMGSSAVEERMRADELALMSELCRESPALSAFPDHVPT